VRAISSRLSRLVLSARSMLIVCIQGCKTGRGCKLSIGVRLRKTDGAWLALGNEVVIDRYADITVKHGSLQIGNRTYIGQFCVITARDCIRIGNDCLVAEHVTIRDQDHLFEFGTITAQGGFTSAPISIGNNVWIGAKATVTKGVRIGDNAVIGANAVVTCDIPANSVAVGAPARVIRTMEVAQ